MWLAKTESSGRFKKKVADKQRPSIKNQLWGAMVLELATLSIHEAHHEDVENSRLLARGQINKDIYVNPNFGGSMSDQYKDEFSDAETELEEKSAYVCDSCNAKYKKEEAKKRGNTCCGRKVTNFSKNISTR